MCQVNTSISQQTLFRAVRLYRLHIYIYRPCMPDYVSMPKDYACTYGRGEKHSVSQGSKDPYAPVRAWQPRDPPAKPSSTSACPRKSDVILTTAHQHYSSTMQDLKKQDQEDSLKWTRGEFEIPSARACGAETGTTSPSSVWTD
jgi:hypothetical protein